MRSNPTPRGFVTVHTDRTQRRAIEPSCSGPKDGEWSVNLTGGVAPISTISCGRHRQSCTSSAKPWSRAGLSPGTSRPGRWRRWTGRTMQIDRMLSYARRQTLNRTD